MTSQNNESASVNSLSLIFKKPKPLLRSREKKKNTDDISNSIPGDVDTSSSKQTNLDKENSSVQQNVSKKFNKVVNFSGVFGDFDESIKLMRKRRMPPKHQRPSIKVSFSKSVDVSEDSVAAQKNKSGYLRKLRKNVKPSKSVEFLSEDFIIDESTMMKSVSEIIPNKKASSFAIWSPSSFSSSPSPSTRPTRRCSTPLKGRSRTIKISEANLSIIPRALPFTENDNQSSTPSILSNLRGISSSPAPNNGSKNENTPTPSTDSAISLRSASFVTRIFRENQEIAPTSVIDENIPPPREKGTVQTPKIYSNPRRRPIFPKLSPYCNKRFYKYLTFKMEPKYGIETNSRVVKICQKLHYLVQNINSVESDYQRLGQKLKKLLFRHSIVHTCYDFYKFSLKFLPQDVAQKVVPIIQPFGRPLLVDFDAKTVFDSMSF